MGRTAGEGDVVMLRIHARDTARAACFYAALFGWIVGEPGAAGLAFSTPGGLRGVFRQGEPSTAGPEIFVGVADLGAALRRAVALGAMALVRPGPAPGGGRVAVVLDPEGNRIGLFEAPGASAAGPPQPEGEPIFQPRAALR
ncbi:MAG: VOC family protein [Pseudomonadota bacterium]|nr:VOC family protein [Pseudomonadota bacterium]